MKKSYKVFAAALSVVMGASTFTSLGSVAQATSSAKQKVIFAYQITSSADPYGKWLKSVSAAYKKKYPNVEIVADGINATENDYYTKLDLAMKSSGTSPDIVNEDTFLINSDSAAGYLSPLDSKAKSWSDWNKNFNNSLKKGVISSNKKLYGIPWSTDSRGIWYNKDVFKKAGLPTKWQPKTWKDILNACKAIKAKCPGVVPLWLNSCKAGGEATSMQTYEMLLYGTGEQLLNSKGKWITSSKNILSTLNFVNSIYKNGYGEDLANAINSQSGNIAEQQQLPKGKLAMALDGYWITGNWKNGGAAPWPSYTKKLGFAAMPTENGKNKGSVTMSGGWALSIPAKANNKNAAWNFIKFALNKSNILSLEQSQGDLSTRNDVAKESKYTSTPFNGVATAFLKNAYFRPANTKYPTVSTLIATMIESVVTGSSTPSQAMSTYGNGVKRIVGAANTASK